MENTTMDLFFDDFAEVWDGTSANTPIQDVPAGCYNCAIVEAWFTAPKDSDTGEIPAAAHWKLIIEGGPNHGVTFTKKSALRKDKSTGKPCPIAMKFFLKDLSSLGLDKPSFRDLPQVISGTVGTKIIVDVKVSGAYTNYYFAKVGSKKAYSSDGATPVTTNDYDLPDF